VRVKVESESGADWEGKEMTPPKFILGVAEDDSVPAETRNGGGGCQSDSMSIGRGCGVVCRVRVRVEAEGRSEQKRNDEWGWGFGLNCEIPAFLGKAEEGASSVQILPEGCNQ